MWSAELSKQKQEANAGIVSNLYAESFENKCSQIYMMLGSKG